MLVAATLAPMPEAVSAQGAAQRSKLTVSIVPKTLPADGATYPSLFVQLVGPDGSPKHSAGPTTVVLGTSDSQVATVPQGITIEGGASYAQVQLTVSSVPGNAKIRAFAPGYGTASADVRTVNPLGAAPPYKLLLYALPEALYPGASGILTIALAGDRDAPALASSDVTIMLTNSNPEVVELPETAVIPRLGHEVRLGWRARAVGRADLLAQADGFHAAGSQVQVVEQGERAVQLQGRATTPSFLSWETERGAIVVQAVDEKGRPAPLPCIALRFSSSAPQVLGVEPRVPLSCDPPLPYHVQEVVPQGRPGDVFVTVAGTGLRPFTVRVATYGLVESRLEIQRAPPQAAAEDSVPALVSVQLLDDSAQPVVFHRGYTVDLIGDGAEVPARVDIPPGSSFVLVPIKPTGASDEVGITAVAAGLGGDSISFVVKRKQLEVSLGVPKQALSLGMEVEIEARVTSSGSPVPNAKVTWSAGGALPEPVETVTDESGIARLALTVQKAGPISVTAGASRPGYVEAEASVSLTTTGGVGQAGEPSRLPLIASFLLAVGALAFYVLYQRRQRKGLKRRESQRPKPTDPPDG